MRPISGADETLVTYATRLLGAGVNVNVLLMFSQPTNACSAAPSPCRSRAAAN